MSNERVYGQHGTRHKPYGSDPSECDIWIYVGEDDRVPFITGTNAPPSASSPDPVPMRFRLALGPPNVCEFDGWAPADPSNPPDPLTSPRPVATSIITYTDHQIEIQGDVTDVSPGDTVFVLPPEYRHNHDVPCHAHDDAGNYVACRLLSTGEFIYGVP